MLRNLKSPETCFQAVLRSWHLHLPFAFSAIIVAGKQRKSNVRAAKSAVSESLPRRRFSVVDQSEHFTAKPPLKK